jgi:anaerobic selenocysteine-containing dehydrogenase/Fe-S-cluster-containing dehydrogenase component
MCMDRRTFLKISGMGSVAFVAGCSDNPQRNLFSLVHAPEDMVTGNATWYATTCRECPAGCGVLAKNREGRVVKLEGNPLHPVNKGKLCARGQAAVQGLYNPDRIRQPLLKTDGGWEPIEYTKAVDIIATRMGNAATRGPQRVAMLTEVVGDALLNLFKATLAQYDAAPPLVYEPFGFEALKFAHAQLFKTPLLPTLNMDSADLLVGFGADFLETWLSPIEYARKFAAMHAIRDGEKGFFVQVSPYQSMTAANADKWFACRPGSEAAVAMMLIQNALAGGRGRHLQTPLRLALLRLSRTYTTAKVAEVTDLPVTELGRLTYKVMKAKRPLVLGTSTASDGKTAPAVELAVALLNVILDPDLSLYDFSQRHRQEITASRSDIRKFWASAGQGKVDLLLLNNTNPLFTLPPGSGVSKALSREGLFTVVFANAMDETAAAADLILPVQMSLESWDIYESKQSVKATLQPALGKITSSPHVGDIFLRLMPGTRRPVDNYRSLLVRHLADQGRIASDQDWIDTFQKGGQFAAQQSEAGPAVNMEEDLARTLSDLLDKLPDGAAGQPMACLAPSIRHFDGRGANRSWLSEVPDPVSQVAWQTLAWIHPKVMSENGWSDGDDVLIETANGKIRAKAYGNSGLHPDAVVIPLGQGHAHYGRYAKDQGADPVPLLGAEVEPLSGSPVYMAAIKQMVGAGKTTPLATTSGSRIQHDRKIALSVPLQNAGSPDKLEGLTMNDFPFTLPMPEGYDHHRDIYAPHNHEKYRWGMVVDLDRCIGCSACAAACYAENNLGVVGEKQIIKGREMAWMRIERYEDPRDPARLIFFPMMCQHCDNAPCESVCPVYAPHHSKEGLNNQIYNRCIGTRFCAQNCPYKVRRFNWLEWKWPDPLNMQLNPDVTVRSKGVMEKCSFCIQRIKAAHNDAKNEKRDIRDGEVTPACVQTCPTSALHFGNFMDEKSVVRRMIEDPRAYQVMGYLNVKPAVIYLKKVTQTL